MIPTSVAILSHMQQCAAIAEVVSGQNVENSLLDAADGQPYVRSKVEYYAWDPLTRVATEKVDRKAKDTTGGKCEERGTDEGSRPVGESTDAVCAVVLLSLDVSKRSKNGGCIVPGKV